MSKTSKIGLGLIILTIALSLTIAIFKTKNNETEDTPKISGNLVEEANYKTTNILSNEKINVLSTKIPRISEEGLKIEIIKNNYISLDSLKVPYINSLNNEQINKRLKGLYEKYEKKFYEAIKKDLKTPIILNYKIISNATTTSVIIVHGTYENNLNLEYITINLDNNEKKIMNLQDVLNKLDKKYNTTYIKLKDEVEKYINNNYSVKEQTIYSNNEKSSSRTVTLEDLEMLFSTNTINYYIDEQEKLKFLVPITLSNKTEIKIFEV